MGQVATPLVNKCNLQLIAKPLSVIDFFLFGTALACCARTLHEAAIRPVLMAVTQGWRKRRFLGLTRPVTLPRVAFDTRLSYGCGSALSGTDVGFFLSLCCICSRESHGESTLVHFNLVTHPVPPTSLPLSRDSRRLCLSQFPAPDSHIAPALMSHASGHSLYVLPPSSQPRPRARSLTGHKAASAGRVTLFRSAVPRCVRSQATQVVAEEVACVVRSAIAWSKGEVFCG